MHEGGSMKRVLSGAAAGLVVGLVIALLTYAVVKPGPCSQTSICIRDGRGGCVPGPCDGRSQHLIALALIVVAGVAAGSFAALVRRRN